MFSPWARDFIRIASVDSAVKWVPGGDNLVKGVQCYELFGGIALKNHTFSFSYQMAIRRRQCDHGRSTSHLWRLVIGLSGKKSLKSPNMDVGFALSTYLYPKMIANKFAHQFTPPPIRQGGDKIKWLLKRKFHQLLSAAPPSFTHADIKKPIWFFKSFTDIVPVGMSTVLF